MAVNRAMILPFAASMALALPALALAQAGPPPAPPPLNPAIAAAIKAAPSQGSVYTVLSDTQFPGAVLKADTITFTSDSQLLMNAQGRGWIAIVARRLQIGAPQQRFTIVTAASNAIAGNGGPIAKAGAAPGGNSGSPASDGSPGSNGADGQTGNAGGHGANSPTIFILAGEIITQPGAPKPNYIDMAVVARGGDGGSGGAGQDGQDGGAGGSGGPARDNGIFGCAAGAGSGGRGGNGGRGGTGGTAGTGGDGSPVVLGGGKQAVDLLSFGRFNTLPGRAGRAGYGGMGGRGGEGGPRGEWRGSCHGGNGGPGGAPGSSGATGASAPDGKRGAITNTSVDVNTLF
ncbi:MAG: hypothetical protein JSS36_08275 [Proteobacteria bacterium]|nr:hypothetical protein [Pseudomonadota bacterium]